MAETSRGGHGRKRRLGSTWCRSQLLSPTVSLAAHKHCEPTGCEPALALSRSSCRRRARVGTGSFLCAGGRCLALHEQSCTRDASRVHSACRAGACCSITAPLHHPQPTPAAEGGALRSRWHALGGTLSVARSLWLAEQHIATTAGSVRQVCAHRSCRGLTCPRAPQRVWSGATGESGSWPRAVRASLDRVSGVEGGGARRRWRLHRHEPRGGGRDTPSCEQPHTSHVALLVLTFDLACVTCKALACVAGARDRASVRSEGVLYFCYYNKRVRDFTQDFRVVCVPHTCRDALVESRACRVCAPRHHTVVCAISAVIGWASFK